MLEVFSIYLGVLLLDIEKIIFAKFNLDKSVVLSKIKFILILLVGSALCTIFSVCFDGILKTVASYSVYILEFKFLFNIDYLKCIFLTFIYAILMLGADLLGLFLITNIIGIDRLECLDKISGSIISGLTVFLTFAIIYYIFRHPVKKILNTKISNNVRLISLSVITLFCVVFFLYIFENEFRTYGNFLPYLITMIVLLVILFSLIRQTFINNKLIYEYDKLLEFMTTYENEIEKQRILRHETKNEFLAIKAKICDKQNNKEIIEYIDEILKDKITINNEKYAKFGNLPPNGIKGLCYFKVQEAEENGISVSINISNRIKKSSIYNLDIKNQRDLGKILGVFLDNAIEASKSSNKKQLGLEFYVNKNNETKVIISNTFNNNINKSKIGRERFTTKGKDRGHGLLLVKHIVGKNKLYETKTEIINDLYIQTLLIKKD